MPTPVPKETVQALEASFKEIAPALRREAPKDYARVVDLMRALKSAKPSVLDIKRLTLELVRWQLTLGRREVAEQRARYAPYAKAGEPAAVEADRALAALEALFDQAIAQTKGKVQESPATAAQRAALEKASALASDAVERAEAAIARSTVAIPMKTLTEQPRSTSGVRLAPVEPTRASKDAGKKKATRPQDAAPRKRPTSPVGRAPQKKR